MKKEPFDPPQWIDREAWDAFVEMRREKGKRAPFTDKARDRLIIMLDRLRQQGHPPGEVLWQSTVSGWTGVFPLKGNPGMQTPTVNPLIAETKRWMAEQDAIPVSRDGPGITAFKERFINARRQRRDA